jgi:hypothetical protein
LKRATRLILLATVAGAALAIAGPAWATFNTQKLNITTQPGLGATGPVSFEVSMAQTDDPLAKVTIYTGVGYGAHLLPTSASGSTIGVVTAQVQAADLGGQILPLAGTVQAADAATTIPVAGQTLPLSTTAQVCTGTPTHAAYWLLVLTAAGQTLKVAAYVDPTSGAETAFAAWKIQVCLPAPDLPTTDPRRATFGAKLFDAKVTLKSVFTNPTTAGTPIWSAFFTPYNPGLGTANPAGTVESRSATAVPAAISLKATYDKKRKAAVLAGSISVLGQPLVGLAVPIYSGSKLTNVKAAGKTTKTNSKGVFGAVKKILKTTYFQVGGILGGGDLTATLCPAFPSLAPGGCVSATTGQIPLFSKVVKVVVPKKKK